jgi:hypothetical protein
MPDQAPYVVVTQVTMANLENLRDKVWSIIQCFGSAPDYWVEVRTEGIAFCFENSNAALLFVMYCAANGIQYHCQ